MLTCGNARYPGAVWVLWPEGAYRGTKEPKEMREATDATGVNQCPSWSTVGSPGGWFSACRAHADALAWHWQTASVPAASLLYGRSEASGRGSCTEQWGPGLSLAPTQHAFPGLCILTELPCYHLGLVLGSGLSGAPSTPRLWAQRWAR